MVNSHRRNGDVPVVSHPSHQWQKLRKTEDARSGRSMHGHQGRERGTEFLGPLRGLGGAVSSTAEPRLPLDTGTQQFMMYYHIS